MFNFELSFYKFYNLYLISNFHFISYIKQDCLYNCNIFSNKHLEIYPNRVYNIKRKGGNHMEEKKECCCHHKTKERSDKEYKDLINRLSRIEGQVRGIKKMVENDTYCTEIGIH